MCIYTIHLDLIMSAREDKNIGNLLSIFYILLSPFSFDEKDTMHTLQGGFVGDIPRKNGYQKMISNIKVILPSPFPFSRIHLVRIGWLKGCLYPAYQVSMQMKIHLNVPLLRR
jgi:hypothetical protein